MSDRDENFRPRDLYYDSSPEDMNCDFLEVSVDSETFTMTFIKRWRDGRQSETIIKEPKNVSKGS
jgi:hypothetical protein